MDLLLGVDRVLRPAGRAAITTPVRLTETPEEPSHVQEWLHARLFTGQLADLEKPR